MNLSELGNMPSKEELKAAADAWYNKVGYLNIEHWAPDILALSMPTKMIEILPNDIMQFIKGFKGEENEAINTYASLIDAEIGWQQHLIKVSARSPKDASHLQIPSSVSGKQLWWVFPSG